MAKIQKIKSSVTYAYVESEDVTSQAVLVVKIAVEDDSEFAAFLLEQISDKLPTYVVEDTLTSQVPSCECISTFSSVEKLETVGLVSSAVKFGLLAGGATFVVACIVVIAVDSFNKKRIAAEAKKAD